MTLPAYPPPALATPRSTLPAAWRWLNDELTPLPGGGLHRTS